MPPIVEAVNRRPGHAFSKQTVDAIRLIVGYGVQDDGHAGETVQHRSRVAQDPDQPNLRQVHLVHIELFEELAPRGFVLTAGDIGENVLTRGVDLLGLPTGAKLTLGGDAVVEITGLRNPCSQLDKFRKGLMKAMLDRAADGSLIRKAGVMAVVLNGGVVRPGDGIRVELPPGPHRALEAV